MTDKKTPKVDQDMQGNAEEEVGQWDHLFEKLHVASSTKEASLFDSNGDGTADDFDLESEFWDEPVFHDHSRPITEVLELNRITSAAAEEKQPEISDGIPQSIPKALSGLLGSLPKEDPVSTVSPLVPPSSSRIIAEQVQSFTNEIRGPEEVAFDDLDGPNEPVSRSKLKKRAEEFFDAQGDLDKDFSFDWSKKSFCNELSIADKQALHSGNLLQTEESKGDETAFAEDKRVVPASVLDTDNRTGVSEEETVPRQLNVAEIETLTKQSDSIASEDSVDSAIQNLAALGAGTLWAEPKYQNGDVEPQLPLGTISEAYQVRRWNPVCSDRDLTAAPVSRTEIGRDASFFERETLKCSDNKRIPFHMAAACNYEITGNIDRVHYHLGKVLEEEPSHELAKQSLRRLARHRESWDEVLVLLDATKHTRQNFESDMLAWYRIEYLVATGELDLASTAVKEYLLVVPGSVRARWLEFELALWDENEEIISNSVEALEGRLGDHQLEACICSIVAEFKEERGQADQACFWHERSMFYDSQLGMMLSAQGTAVRYDDNELINSVAKKLRETTDGDIGAAFSWIAIEEEGNEVKREEQVRCALQASPQNIPILLAAVEYLPTLESINELEQLFSLVKSAPWKKHIFLQIAKHRGLEGVLLHVENNPQWATEVWLLDWVRREQECLGGIVAPFTSFELDADSAVTPGSKHALALRTYQHVDDLMVEAKSEEALACLLTSRDEQWDCSKPLRTLAQDIALEQGNYSFVNVWENESTLSTYRVAQLRSRYQCIQEGDEQKEKLIIVAEVWEEACTEHSVVSQLPRWISLMAGNTGKAFELGMKSLLTLKLEHQKRKGGTCAFEHAIVETHAMQLRDSPALAWKGVSGGTENSSIRILALGWCFALGARDWEGAAESQEAIKGCLGEEQKFVQELFTYRGAFVRFYRNEDAVLAASSLIEAIETRSSFGAASELLATYAEQGEADETFSLPANIKILTEADDDVSILLRLEKLAGVGELDTAQEGYLEILCQGENILVQEGFESFCWKNNRLEPLLDIAERDKEHAEGSGDTVGLASAHRRLGLLHAELGREQRALEHRILAWKLSPMDAFLARCVESSLHRNNDAKEHWRKLYQDLLATLPPGKERSHYALELAREAESKEQAKRWWCSALCDDLNARMSLFNLEKDAWHDGPNEMLAGYQSRIAMYFYSDKRAKAAFLLRGAEIWRKLKFQEKALQLYGESLVVLPGGSLALMRLKEMAIEGQQWEQLAAVFESEGEVEKVVEKRVALYHLAAIAYLESKDDCRQSAIAALQRVLLLEPGHWDSFLRLRKMYQEEHKYDELCQLSEEQLEMQTEPSIRRGLHHQLATIYAKISDSHVQRLLHFRGVLSMYPNDKEAVHGIADIAWQEENWEEAAELLMMSVRIETSKPALAKAFFKLGLIYSEHIDEPQWALRSFKRVLSIVPDDLGSLDKLAALARQQGDAKLSLGALEQLLNVVSSRDEKIEVLHRAASVFEDLLDDTNQAERLLRTALDLDDTNGVALEMLAQFFLRRKDSYSLRVHMDRVVSSMRTRLQQDIQDTGAYGVIDKAIGIREQAGETSSKVVGQSARRMIWFLEKERLGYDSPVSESSFSMVTQMTGDSVDELLFAEEAPLGVRTLFAVLNDRLIKHVGKGLLYDDMRRSHKLRRKADSFSNQVYGVCRQLGVSGVEVSVSETNPWGFAALSGASNVMTVGAGQLDLKRPVEMRFVLGRLSKMLSSGLCVPIQIGPSRFGVLLVALLRLFEPNFFPLGTKIRKRVLKEQLKLKKLIPKPLLAELRPHALSVIGNDFDYLAIWHALVGACNRVGLVCSGDVAYSTLSLMKYKKVENTKMALQDVEITDLIRFSCSKEYAQLYDLLDP